MSGPRLLKGLDSFRGNWGLITGGSSGIGREFARRAAASGMNLVVVARNRDPLDRLASEIKKEHNVQVRVFCSDFSQENEPHRLAGELRDQGIRIQFLCHAAGFGSWGPFMEGNPLLFTKLVNLNTNALIALLFEFHDDLASHLTSAVVIVSSRAGYHPLPNMAVYSAAKSFSQTLSQALFSEWEKEGIIVQALMPGAVDTALEANQSILSEGILRRKDMESPDEVVKASLAGLASRKPRVITGKGVGWQRFFSTILPRKLFLRAVMSKFQKVPKKPKE